MKRDAALIQGLLKFNSPSVNVIVKRVMGSKPVNIKCQYISILLSMLSTDLYLSKATHEIRSARGRERAMHARHTHSVSV